MYVQVDNSEPLHRPRVQEEPRCDGQVVDDAEAGAKVVEGMVGT